MDLESAYHHVDMHPESIPHLGFCWKGQYYVFCSLPFGLSSACWVFTMLTRELVGSWRAICTRLLHYLDDFLFAVAADPSRSLNNFYAVRRRILTDLAEAGFSTAAEKLELEPAQRRQFLGFIC